MLPEIPVMLLSYINTKLRDEYSSLEDLCDGLDVSEEDITAKLASIGYHYSKELNKFTNV
ncbi:MAG: DUF4250 domain-containing protein [Erysipelotrichaceae bacterium]|nr:DUF4250 domain-containing protein [Erysipelotrichaceae bacterium]